MLTELIKVLNDIHARRGLPPLRQTWPFTEREVLEIEHGFPWFAPGWEGLFAEFPEPQRRDWLNHENCSMCDSMRAEKRPRGVVADHGVVRRQMPTDYQGRRIVHAHFQRADLTGADFRYTDIVHGYFQGADLTDADFTGATITHLHWDDDTINLPAVLKAKRISTSVSIHENMRRGVPTVATVEIDAFQPSLYSIDDRDVLPTRLPELA